MPSACKISLLSLALLTLGHVSAYVPDSYQFSGLRRPTTLHRAPRLRTAPTLSQPRAQIRLSETDETDAASEKQQRLQQKRLEALRLAEEAARAMEEADKAAATSRELRAEVMKRQQENDALKAKEAASLLPAKEQEMQKTPAEDAPEVTDQPEPEPEVKKLINLPGFQIEVTNSTGPGSDMSSLSPLFLEGLLGATPLRKDDIEQLRGCFLMEDFFLTDVEPTNLGVVFRGNLRVTGDAAYKSATAELQKRPLLAQRVDLFLMKDPITDPQDAGAERSPVFLALASKDFNDVRKETTLQLAVAVAGVLFGTFTAAGFGLSGYALNTEFIAKLEGGDVEQALKAVPIALGLLSIQASHETGHFVMAKKTGVKLAAPLLLPSLQLGLWGAITRYKDFPPNRQALFDTSIAGPLAGMSISAVVYLVGLVLTSIQPAATLSELCAVPGGLLHCSALLGTLAEVILPGSSTQTLVSLHPAAVVGLTAFYINCLNMLPIGRLDGGRVASAMVGSETAQLIGPLMLLLQGVIVLGGGNEVLLWWGFVCVILQRTTDIPPQQDVDKISNQRMALGATTLFIAISSIIPYPYSP